MHAARLLVCLGRYGGTCARRRSGCSSASTSVLQGGMKQGDLPNTPRIGCCKHMRTQLQNQIITLGSAAPSSCCGFLYACGSRLRRRPSGRPERCAVESAFLWMLGSCLAQMQTTHHAQSSCDLLSVTGGLWAARSKVGFEAAAACEHIGVYMHRHLRCARARSSCIALAHKEPCMQQRNRGRKSYRVRVHEASALCR